MFFPWTFYKYPHFLQKYAFHLLIVVNGQGRLCNLVLICTPKLSSAASDEGIERRWTDLLSNSFWEPGAYQCKIGCRWHFYIFSFQMFAWMASEIQKTLERKNISFQFQVLLETLQKYDGSLYTFLFWKDSFSESGCLLFTYAAHERCTGR